MEVLIPARFYGFDSVTYTLASFIAFLVSYHAFKLYSATQKNSHKYLYLSFTLMSMGLLVLAAASWYNYFNFGFLNRNNLLDQLVSMDDFAYWIYYASTTVAYLLLMAMYFPERRFPILFLPTWTIGLPYFNIVSLFLLSFVVFRSLINFFGKKSLSTFLVSASFSLLGLYHLLLLFTSFSKVIYVAAHLSLGLGFLSLLAMLVMVNRK